MNKLVILVMFFVGCSSVDPVSTQITVNETPAIESSKAGEYTTTTKLRIKKNESCPYYPVFETDIEYTYYCDGLIRTVHYISDNIGIYFEYEEIGDVVQSKVYKYREDVSNRIETSTIEDISTLPNLLFMDTISYTNSGYKDTTLIISTANEGQNIEDYFDKYIINSKGQVDSIYHHNFGGGLLASFEYFTYNTYNQIDTHVETMNLFSLSKNGRVKSCYIYDEIDKTLNEVVQYSYDVTELDDMGKIIVYPDTRFLYNSQGKIISEESIKDDTTMIHEYTYNDSKYLVGEYEYYGTNHSLTESSNWEYDAQNNLICEKLTIKADGKYSSEAIYEYDTVEVTVKNEQRFKEIRAFNEMVFQSHHMYMLNGIYQLDKL